MTPADYRDQQIERYVHDRMDANERLQFEKQIESDIELKKEVQELLILVNDFDNDLLEFKKKLDIAESELNTEAFFTQTQNFKNQPNKVKSFGNSKLIRWLVAASLIIVLSILFLNYNEPDYHQLAINGVQNDFKQLRDVDDTLGKLMGSGLYTEYISKAQQILKDSSLDEVNQQLAVNIVRSYILMEKPEEAIRFMDKHSFIVERSCSMQLAKALAMIDLKQKENAIEILEKIECSREEFFAKKLLQQL